MPMSRLPPAVRIVAVEAVRVAVLAHRGDPARVDETARRFAAWRRNVGLPPATSATFNILYEGPNDVAPADFRLDLCAATAREIAPNDAGVVAGMIPGGRCAVLRHVGADDGLGAALAYLCAEWLPQSGETRRDAPLYCQRVAFGPTVPEAETITDIFLPLR